MKNVSFIILFVFLCGVLFLAPSSLAQPGLQSSSDKDVAFSYYKVAGSSPHFKRWVENLEPYTNTPMAKREDVMTREVNLLRTEFERFSPSDDLITVKTKVTTRIKPPQDPESEHGYFEYEYTKAPGDNPKMFLYEYAGDHFALVVENIDDYRSFEIPVRQLDYFRREIRRNVNRELTAVLQLLPSAADTEEPYMLDDQEYWLLSSKIAAISFWNPQGRLIHQYTAPWYYSPVNRELEDLKSKQEKQDDLIDQGLDLIETPAE